jgi:hypothetical protein
VEYLLIVSPNDPKTLKGKKPHERKKFLGTLGVSCKKLYEGSKVIMEF